MKNIYSYLTLLVFLGLSPNVYAQRDSVRTEYLEENDTHSDYSHKENYRYFTRAHVEEKTMFKIGASGSSGFRNGWITGLNARFINTISVERKLSPSFSLMLEVENRFSFSSASHSGSVSSPNYFIPGGKYYGYTLGLTAAVRYYYSIKRLMKEGISANNFSNNYFSIQSTNYVLNHTFNNSSSESLFKGPPVYGFGYANTWTGTKSISLLWGFQRRIGRKGFVDFNLGPSFNIVDAYSKEKERYGFEFQQWIPNMDVNLSIGLGW